MDWTHVAGHGLLFQDMDTCFELWKHVLEHGNMLRDLDTLWDMETRHDILHNDTGHENKTRDMMIQDMEI